RRGGMVPGSRRLYAGRVLWLDGGDTLHGTTVANLFFGVSVVDLYNQAGVDAMAAGNHDYNYGADVLLLRAADADFPILGANTFYKESGESFLPPYAFFEIGRAHV